MLAVLFAHRREAQIDLKSLHEMQPRAVNGLTKWGLCDNALINSIFHLFFLCVWCEIAPTPQPCKINDARLSGPRQRDR